MKWKETKSGNVLLKGRDAVEECHIDRNGSEKSTT